jgi:hypothetical protein
MTSSIKLRRCGLVGARLAVAAIAVAVLASSCGSSHSSTTSSSPKPTSGKITVQSTETFSAHVTNGGPIATGHFTISGAITDQGRVTDYRTAKGNKLLFRRVVVGKDGTITFLITLYGVAPGRWTITSATKSYMGLHGSGAQTADNAGSTPATFTLAGTVSH